MTKGPVATEELAWTMAAMRSLPVPLGPVMSTGRLERATWQASAKNKFDEEYLKSWHDLGERTVGAWLTPQIHCAPRSELSR